MRLISDAKHAAWKAAFKGGNTRPVTRATIQRLNVQLCGYQRVQNNLPGPAGVFSTAVFGQSDQPIELPNLASVKWTRSVNQDAAQCDLVLWNTERLAVGEVPPDAVSFDKPGWFTFNRGVDPLAVTRWGLAANGWRDMLVPDRVIRTFEGYGFDPTVAPEADANLQPSGVWLIDDVTYNDDGTIAVSCRDLARILIDQIWFPPVVPFAEYPITWVPETTSPGPTTVVTATTWDHPVWQTDSGQPYIGLGYLDGQVPYVDSTGAVFGHPGRNAFDKDQFGGGAPPPPVAGPSPPIQATYWMSPGNAASAGGDSFEYVQGSVVGQISAVQLAAWGGPYKVYVSVMVNGSWVGTSYIPYVAPVSHLVQGTHFVFPATQLPSVPNDLPAGTTGATWNGTNWQGYYTGAVPKVDTGAKIPFVGSFTAAGGASTSYVLPTPIANATAIRLTFTGLTNSGVGTYKYRCGAYDVTVSSTVVTTTTSTVVAGNMSDYTDVVKWICAWGGFFWPDAATGLDFITYSDGTQRAIEASVPDSTVLPTGRVWGDFENSGVNALVPLTPDLFDKKPLMDAITYIRNILNFIFFVDEAGGVVWRSPNIWSQGNYIGNSTDSVDLARTLASRTPSVIVIDEKETIMGLQPKLSSRNIREQFFVANTDGEFGAVSPPQGSTSYNPYPSGLRRVAGWTDQHFATQQECQVMADLIALRSKLTYRTNRLTIPGTTAIQVDDQVQVMEKVTGESYLHYVSAITSDWDAKTGKWTYELTTNWLGSTPFTQWTFDPALLAPETKLYLQSIGKI